MLLSNMCSETTLEPMNMDAEPEQAPSENSEQQDFQSAAVQARRTFEYAWKYAMAANGQPLAVR